MVIIPRQTNVPAITRVFHPIIVRLITERNRPGQPDLHTPLITETTRRRKGDLINKVIRVAYELVAFAKWPL
jgi:hypothetical protein